MGGVIEGVVVMMMGMMGVGVVYVVGGKIGC
jgi:hypothetical protein